MVEKFDTGDVDRYHKIGWNPAMNDILGRFGRVMKIDPEYVLVDFGKDEFCILEEDLEVV